MSPGSMSTTTWSVSPTRAPSTRTWPRPGTCSSSFNLCCPRNSTKQYQYSISWCSEVFENPLKLDSLMVSKTRADDYKIQIQRFRDQPEIFYLELTWFSKSPSPASPTLPCASPSHVCSTYTYPSTQRRSRHVTVTRCSNVDGEISIINWNHSQVEDQDQVSWPQHADQARPRSQLPRLLLVENCF